MKHPIDFNEDSVGVSGLGVVVPSIKTVPFVVMCMSVESVRVEETPADCCLVVTGWTTKVDLSPGWIGGLAVIATAAVVGASSISDGNG